MNFVVSISGLDETSGADACMRAKPSPRRTCAPGTSSSTSSASTRTGCGISIMPGSTTRARREPELSHPRVMPSRFVTKAYRKLATVVLLNYVLRLTQRKFVFRNLAARHDPVLGKAGGHDRSDEPRRAPTRRGRGERRRNGGPRSRELAARRAAAAEGGSAKARERHVGARQAAGARAGRAADRSRLRRSSRSARWRPTACTRATCTAPG